MIHVKQGPKISDNETLAATPLVIYRGRIYSGFGADERWNGQLERWMKNGELYAGEKVEGKK